LDCCKRKSNSLLKLLGKLDPLLLSDVFRKVHLQVSTSLLADFDSDVFKLRSKSMVLSFPKKEDITKFDLSITPEDGYWKGCCYKFSFEIPPEYPHSPPKVRCLTPVEPPPPCPKSSRHQVFHPNIDTEGKVCLNILREEWKPVLDVAAVCIGLMNLFLVPPSPLFGAYSSAISSTQDPNPTDPLNKGDPFHTSHPPPSREQRPGRCCATTATSSKCACGSTSASRSAANGSV
jgi:ubiquitin-protein ligase